MSEEIEEKSGYLEFTGNPATVKRKVAFMNYFRKGLGDISSACKKAKVTRQLYYYWIKNDENFKAEVEFTDDEIVDIGQRALLKKVKQGDTRSIIYLLNSKGRKRGYGNTLILENKKEDIEEMTDEEIIEELNRLRDIQNNEYGK